MNLLISLGTLTCFTIFAVAAGFTLSVFTFGLDQIHFSATDFMTVKTIYSEILNSCWSFVIDKFFGRIVKT
jgi:hypothetical protein